MPYIHRIDRCCCCFFSPQTMKKNIRRQALQVALYATWIAGLLCIIISLYATQLLMTTDEGEWMKKNGGGGGEKKNGVMSISPSLTLFSIPAPFQGMVGAAQERAVRSWLRLSPHIRVVLIGKHPSLMSFALNMAPSSDRRVFVESDIDFTFSGAPLLNSIMARMQSSFSDIAVLLDPQFILIQDFLETIQHAHTFQHSWLLVAMAKSLPDFPFQLNSVSNFWINEENQRVDDKMIRKYAKSHGVWKSCTGRYLWAWSTDNVPLHVAILPSFVYGYGFHHEWLLNEALSSGLRFVFDASEAVMAFYSSLGDDRDPHHWEEDNNARLAALYGSFYFRPPDFVNAPAKLVKCGDSRLSHFQFVYPLLRFQTVGKPDFGSQDAIGIYDMSSQQQPWKKDGIMSSFRRFGLAQWQTNIMEYPCPATGKRTGNNAHMSWKKKIMMGRLSESCDCRNDTDETRLDCPSSHMKRVASMRLTNGSTPTSLDSLLAKVSNSDKVIVLSVVANNYRDMLMNWVCRLRKLQVTNFIIGAIDMQLYEFAVLQGLPVFMSGQSMKLSYNDCHFGTDCFKKVTKMKSHTVLQILRLGYRVLFSDVDVYWFENPIQYMMSYGPRAVVAQSDEWNVTEAINKPRRLNSGFYFAWPDPSTTKAFEKIVAHASVSNMSEQPSFYDTLCGLSGRYRLGDTQCWEPEMNVTTYFLDRNMFPNGAFNNLWMKRNVSEACRLQGCVVLHNNWVSGRQRKLSRQILSGLWDYDVKTRICVWGWHTHKIEP